MAHQYSHFLYPPGATLSQIIPSTNDNILRSSPRTALSPYPQGFGGEPMCLTNSKDSSYSNASRSSFSTAASASTAHTSVYGSAEQQSYMTNFNTNGMAGASYNGFDDNYHLTGRFESYPSSTYSPSSADTDVKYTPSRLGWTPEKDYHKLYKLYLKKGEAPWLELLDEHDESFITPKVVFLDEDQARAKDSCPCMYPINCFKDKDKKSPSVFSRPADLWRHYKHVHKAKVLGEDKAGKYLCPYKNCPRAQESDPFGRKDHFRDHLKDFHKQDIGVAKKGAKMSDEEWRKEQIKWEAERVISSENWICGKCLFKNVVKKHGWKCSRCDIMCEQDRKDKRIVMGKQPSTQQKSVARHHSSIRQHSSAQQQSYASQQSYALPEVQSSTAQQSYEISQQPYETYADCTSCNGTAYVPNASNNGWILCPNCQQSSPYDISRDGDYEMDFDYSPAY